ncbi:Rv3235 family protein [Streptomyces physcomitrii]
MTNSSTTTVFTTPSGTTTVLTTRHSTTTVLTAPSGTTTGRGIAVRDATAAIGSSAASGVAAARRTAATTTARTRTTATASPTATTAQGTASADADAASTPRAREADLLAQADGFAKVMARNRRRPGSGTRPPGRRDGRRPGAALPRRQAPAPEPHPAEAFAERLLAVLSGQRPVHWMLRHTASSAYDELASLAERTPLGTCGPPPVVRDLGWCVPQEGAMEAFARIAADGRVRAMAYRLERGRDLRWRCTAVELGAVPRQGHGQGHGQGQGQGQERGRRHRAEAAV